MVLVAVWAVLTLTYGVATGVTKNAGSLEGSGFFPLNMAPYSVDDMYSGCRDKMLARVKTGYLATEKIKDKNFTVAWGEAEKYYNRKWNRKRRPVLGKEQIMAVYTYTLDKPRIYLAFNDAVRNQRSRYKTTFKYHALHFYLTDAIQTLSARRAKAGTCLTGYRKVDSYFDQNILNKELRFGAFTSTSLGWYNNAARFGDKSCFEIVTCAGADISLYSRYGETERELLIPPYEVFKVVKIKKRSQEKSLPCEVVYTLRTTGKALSNLNCALV